MIRDDHKSSLFPSEIEKMDQEFESDEQSGRIMVHASQNKWDILIQVIHFMEEDIFEALQEGEENPQCNPYRYEALLEGWGIPPRLAHSLVLYVDPPTN